MKFFILILLLFASSAWPWAGGYGGSGGGGSGTGDVTGPAGATTDALVCFDGGTGKSIKQCIRVTIPAPSISNSPPLSPPPMTFWASGTTPVPPYFPSTLYFWNGGAWVVTSGTAEFNEDVFTPTFGQTVFTLSLPFKGAGASVLLAVNGVLDYIEGVDFTITGTTLTWMGPFTLTGVDQVIARYQTK
jgi:hypothetical protein